MRDGVWKWRNDGHRRFTRCEYRRYGSPNRASRNSSSAGIVKRKYAVASSASEPANKMLFRNSAPDSTRRIDPKYSGWRHSEYGPSDTTKSLLRPPIWSVAQNLSPAPATNTAHAN